MRAMLGLVALVLVLAVVAHLVKTQWAAVGTAGVPMRQIQEQDHDTPAVTPSGQVQQLQQQLDVLMQQQRRALPED